MMKFEEFKKFKIIDINTMVGGVQDTTYKKKTGLEYKDYKYDRNEINETDSYECQCSKTGGTDKTNTLVCN